MMKITDCEWKGDCGGPYGLPSQGCCETCAHFHDAYPLPDLCRCKECSEKRGEAPLQKPDCRKSHESQG